MRSGNLSVEKGQQVLFDDGRYFDCISNDWGTPAEQIVFLANGRCNQENLIAQLKNGAKALMRECPNIWAQINFTAVTNGVIEHLVEQVGAERVLFRMDSPMRDPRPQGAWLAFSRLSEEDKRKTFGGSFRRVLAATTAPFILASPSPWLIFFAALAFRLTYLP